MSFYNSYLFITQNRCENFSLAELWINNTFNIQTEAFMKKEKTEIIKAKSKIKIQTILETGTSRNFNSCRMTIKGKSIMVVQKNQVEKLVFIDIKDNAKNDNMCNNIPAKLLLNLYTKQKLYLITHLPFSQKNQVMRILLFSTNGYNCS